MEVEEAGSGRRIDPTVEGDPCTDTEPMAEVLEGEEWLRGEERMAELDVDQLLAVLLGSGRITRGTGFKVGPSPSPIIKLLCAMIATASQPQPRMLRRVEHPVFLDFHLRPSVSLPTTHSEARLLSVGQGNARSPTSGSLASVSALSLTGRVTMIQLLW